MEGSNCSSCGNEAVAHSTGYGMKDHPLNLPGVHYMIFEKNIGHIRGIRDLVTPTQTHHHHYQYPISLSSRKGKLLISGMEK